MIHKLKLYLYRMAKAASKAKKKQQASKTMEELTKGFEEFMEGKGLNPDEHVDFDKAMEKVVKPGKKPAR